MRLLLALRARFRLQLRPETPTTNAPENIRGLAFGGLALAIGILITGCQPSPSANGPAKLTKLRIGHQKADALSLLHNRGDLDRRLASDGIKVEWLEFPAGPPLLEALGVGSLDIGSTGESPPIFAQAAGTPLTYVANIPLSTAPGKGQALLVAQNSPAKSITDLKGKRIAVAKGSGAHNFIIQVLEKAGLNIKDVEFAYLSPPDARVAFESGRVDGWAIWEPFLTVAQEKLHARVLADAANVISPGSFYLASKDFAAHHRDVLKIVLEEIQKTSKWAYDNPKDATAILAKASGVAQSTLLLLQSNRPVNGILPIDEKIISAQQTVADNYFRIGILPKKVNVRDYMLTPQEYRALTSGEGTK
jgi:sulfonate transport system substrate-binding protein